MYQINFKRLLNEDFQKPCKELALYLLGKVLVRKLENGMVLMGKIVETECYLGGEDKASHSYNGKVTKRNEPMYMPAGTSYVYMLYYGYHCFNISSLEPGSVVLIRALQPLYGMEVMQHFRTLKCKTGIDKKINPLKICDGPSKLCMAMNITKENSNKVDLGDPINDMIWLEDAPELNEEITVINTSRIGIGPSAEEWVTMPLRYYILNNKSVSKRDKQAEKELDFEIKVEDIIV